MYILYYVVLFVNVLFCNCQSSTLIIDVVEVSSTENAKFACNVSSATTLTRWTNLPGSTETSLMRFQNGICSVSPSDSFLIDSNRYSYTCNSTVYQVTVHPTAGVNWNNHILACRDAVQPDGSGSTWMIKYVQDGEQCNCYPTITFNVKEVTEGDNVLFVCRVPSDVALVNWNVNFALHTAAMGVQNGQCSTSPSPSFLDNTSEYIYTCNKTVYQVTRLNVRRSEHNDMYMCTPQFLQEGQGSNWIIKVKAPVKSVTMTPADNKVDVLENTVVKFTCTTSTVRPSASVYWYKHPNGNSNDVTQITENITTTTDYNDFSVITSTLRFVPGRQHNNMRTFCVANNSVNTSPVMSIKKLLNVLYKADNPYIIQGSEYRVRENNPGTLSCSVRGGNPTPTLSWSCNNFSPTKQSTIHSNGNTTTTLTWTVLRSHNGTCTCTSQQAKFQNQTIDVASVVLYAARVTSFIVERFTTQTVTVNESDPVPFTCVADSNPTAVTTLSYESKMMINVTSNNVKYTIDKASCLDAGKYVCIARNVYNGEENVRKEVQLFVNCYPRATGLIDTNITGGLNNTKTLVFNVIAYPPPTFTWWQFVDEAWTKLSNDDNFNIQSSNHQSNLTIRRVGMEDFTRYTVIVENEVGKMEQLYILYPYDKPDPPTGFRHLESRTTISSLHLEWKPGFDNGPSQAFFIKYKRSSDTLWNYIDVPDNGEQTMEHTLTGLTENTQYEIVILASNEKGNSSESSVLVPTTKAISEITISQSMGPLIGGVIGGTVGLVIIIALVVFVGRRNSYINGCFGKLKKSDGINNSADDHAYYNVGRLDATAANQCSDDTRINRPRSDANGISHTTEEAAYYNVESVPVPTYEMINRNYMDSTPYSTLEQTEQGTTSDVTSGDKKEIYENLKIQVF